MKSSGNIFRFANERCGALAKTVKTGALRRKNRHTGKNLSAYVNFASFRVLV